MRFTAVRFAPVQVAVKAGSCAAKGYESRQIREEAAVNNILWVPQGNLTGVNCAGSACYRKSNSGARSYIYIIYICNWLILK